VSAVSVVVLTHQRAAEAARTVERLLALPEAPPVIVVDNGSSDGTASTIRARFPSVRLLALSVNLGAAARNVGVLAAATDYVALCDDDTWWAPGALARAVAMLDAHPRLAVVTGRVLVGADGHEDPTCTLMATSPLEGDPDCPGPRVLGFLAGAAVLRRAAFLAAGGFEPRFFLGGEEALLAIDLAARGWLLAYTPGVIAHHHPSPRRGPAAQRRQLLLRNALWCAWLRRSAPDAMRASLALLREHREQRLPATLAALAGVAWVVRHRRVAPAAVQRALRRLDGVAGRRAVARS
jgi:GT2 family glycosyltransferase